MADAEMPVGIMPVGIILFAHGSRDPSWAMPMRSLAERIERSAPGTPIRLAFLESMSPDLEGAIGEMIAMGIASIRVAPLFLGQGIHMRRDLGLKTAEVRQAHPELRIEILPSVGEAEPVLEAMAAWIVGAPAP